LGLGVARSEASGAGATPMVGEEGWCPFKCRSCGGKKMCRAVKPRKFVMDDRHCREEYEVCGLYIVRMGMDNE
jgi:hypothetical protein